MMSDDQSLPKFKESSVHLENGNTGDAIYRWFILVLAGLTGTLAVAMPSMAMPVLFSEMSEDLGLSLVQVGMIWGTGSLAGLFTGLVGGAIGDRFGANRTLAVGCLALGLKSILLGLSNSFTTLFGTVFGTVLLAELGDKTQLATLLYASEARHPRTTVFLAAAAALVVSTALAVLAGGAIGRFVSPKVLGWIAGLAFIAVGVWTIVGAQRAA